MEQPKATHYIVYRSASDKIWTRRDCYSLKEAKAWNSRWCRGKALIVAVDDFDVAMWKDAPVVEPQPPITA